MTAFYLDHGAYASALGATPTWGVPQDGDGSATTAATAASVGSIDFNGITADATDTIVIAGATLTCVASGAAANQFNAASGATLATNVAAAINAATNSVSTSVARSLSNNANQLRNMCYARVVSSTIVEIMFRIGSAQLNYANNTYVAVSQSGLSAAPTIVQFAGGSGGCFGWFTNVNAIGVSSSIALATYGVFSYPPHVCANGTGVSNYALTIADPVECRNNGKTISKSLTTGQTQGRSHSSPLWMRVDDGTIWNGDSSSAQMTFRLTLDANSTTYVLQFYSNNERLIFEARRRKGFRVSIGGANYSGVTANMVWCGTTNTSSGRFKNIELYEDHTYATTFIGMMYPLTSCFASGGCGWDMLFEDCDFTQGTSRNSDPQFMLAMGGSHGYSTRATVHFENCKWSLAYSGAGDPPSGLIRASGGVYGYPYVWITGGEVVSSVVGGFPLLTGTAWGPLLGVYVTGLKGVKIVSAIAQLQKAGSAAIDSAPTSRTINITLPDVGRSMRYENNLVVADWMPSSGYPYLNATLPDGTGWSMRGFWSSIANVLTVGRPGVLPRIVKQYRESDAGKIITLKFWAKAALTYDDFNFRVLFQFVDSTGAVNTNIVGGSNVIDAADSWSNTGTYSAPTYEAKEISFDTDTTLIKQNTEIIVIVSFMNAPSSGSNESIFFDPELTLSAT